MNSRLLLFDTDRQRRDARLQKTALPAPAESAIRRWLVVGSCSVLLLLHLLVYTVEAMKAFQDERTGKGVLYSLFAVTQACPLVLLGTHSGLTPWHIYRLLRGLGLVLGIVVSRKRKMVDTDARGAAQETLEIERETPDRSR
jgi:hypothetical protein